MIKQYRNSDIARFSDKKKKKSQKRGRKSQAWIQGALARLAETKQVALGLSPGVEIMVTNNSTTFNAYSSLRELVSACYAAVQGASAKTWAQGALNAIMPNATSGTAAAGTPVWGWRIRLTGSVNNFAARPIQIDVGVLANSAGGVLSCPSPVLTLVVYAPKAPCDIIVLSPSNAGGAATVVRGQNAEVIATSTSSSYPGILIANISDANTFGIVESLNARDLIARPQLLKGLHDDDDGDDDEDNFGDFSSEAYEGVRDDNFGSN